MKLIGLHAAILLAVCNLTAGVATAQVLAEPSALAATPSSVVIHRGHAAVQKELEIIETVIADTSRAVLEGKSDRKELEWLVERRATLSKLLLEPEPKSQNSVTVNSPNQSATLYGCGQSLTIALTNGSGPGGVLGMDVASYASINSSFDAFVQGNMYAIAKNPLSRSSQVETFRYRAPKTPSGMYTSRVGASVSQSFIGCTKAFVTGSISAGFDGSPLSCGVVPVMLEFSGESNTFPPQIIPSCDDAL